MRLVGVFAIALWPVLAAGEVVRPAADRAREPAKIPFSDESLHYSINWPSGLSVGEAQMQASRSQARWSFAFSVDAAFPGASAMDSYHSLAAGDFCSAEFTKQSTHGKRKAFEKTVFDSRNGTATRETLDGGGSSRMEVSNCARDALTFLFYLRHELADGRLPRPQTVYFGAPYQVRLEFGGEQTVRVNDQPAVAERVMAAVKGPSSDATIEMFFATDAARTPLLVRVPLAAGRFSLELER